MKEPPAVVQAAAVVIGVQVLLARTQAFWFEYVGSLQVPLLQTPATVHFSNAHVAPAT